MSVIKRGCNKEYIDEREVTWETSLLMLVSLGKLWHGGGESHRGRVEKGLIRPLIIDFTRPFRALWLLVRPLLPWAAMGRLK